MGSSVERVNGAMRILKGTRASDLKIENKILYTPLYTGTALERPNKTTAHGTDEVVRKNLYFLAEHLKNVQQLLIQLIQRGFLNLTERETVVKHDDEFLKCVEILSILIKKESNRFQKLMAIFRETGNEEVVNLLENAIVPENSAGAAAAAGTPNSPVKPARLPVFPAPVQCKPWNCSHCTFQNTQGNVCQMCSKSNIKFGDRSSPAPTISMLCPVCTFRNTPDSINCEMCEALL